MKNIDHPKDSLKGFVDCPELGKISVNRCLREKRTPLNDTPHRIKMFPICEKCKGKTMNNYAATESEFDFNHINQPSSHDREPLSDKHGPYLLVFDQEEGTE